jgi:hypothetical protein
MWPCPSRSLHGCHSGNGQAAGATRGGTPLVSFAEHHVAEGKARSLEREGQGLHIETCEPISITRDTGMLK